MEYGRGQSHAYIISAPPEEGYRAAMELARTLVCSGSERPCGVCRHCRKAAKGIHPDIITVSRALDEKGRQKREIYVDQIREIVADAAILPNEADMKVYIVRDAGTMNPPAQNAFLKILEEPPYFTAFILVADNAGTLLETVRSRCVTRYLNGEENAPSADARTRAEQFLSYAAAGARVSLLSFANANADLSNAEMLEFVRAGKELLADMLCGRLPSMKMERRELMRLTELLKTAERYLLANVGQKHVLGLLAVDAVKNEKG